MPRATWVRKAIIGVLVASVYFGAGRLGLRFAFLYPSATPVWPPTGIALVALLILGYRFWPAIFAGAFLVSLATDGHVATALGFAVGNTLEGLTGAYLVSRFAAGRNALQQPRNVLLFTLLGTGLATMLSPTIGLTDLALSGYAQWSRYGAIWVTWWLGNMGGGLVVAPALLLWYAQPRLRWSFSRWSSCCSSCSA
jgi:integral membrane sensor domain MASE1